MDGYVGERDCFSFFSCFVDVPLDNDLLLSEIDRNGATPFGDIFLVFTNNIIPYFSTINKYFALIKLAWKELVPKTMRGVFREFSGIAVFGFT